MKYNSEQDSQNEDAAQGNIKPGTCQISTLHASNYTRSEKPGVGSLQEQITFSDRTCASPSSEGKGFTDLPLETSKQVYCPLNPNKLTSRK